MDEMKQMKNLDTGGGNTELKELNKIELLKISKVYSRNSYNKKMKDLSGFFPQHNLEWCWMTCNCDQECLILTFQAIAYWWKLGVNFHSGSQEQPLSVLIVVGYLNPGFYLEKRTCVISTLAVVLYMWGHLFLEGDSCWQAEIPEVFQTLTSFLLPTLNIVNDGFCHHFVIISLGQLLKIYWNIRN